MFPAFFRRSPVIVSLWIVIQKEISGCFSWSASESWQNQWRRRSHQLGAGCTYGVPLYANYKTTRGLLRDKSGNVNLNVQFYDEAKVSVKAGSGGVGVSTFKLLGAQRGPPNGASGGKGGDIVLQCKNSMNTLGDLRGSAHFFAESGSDGGSHFKTGRDAPEVTVFVPPGIVVTDLESGELLGELQLPGSRMLVARGGDGGRGNAANRPRRGEAPRATPPSAGEQRLLKLELKLVADVGLVGAPNAGKSTLLGAASNAKPKIADYPYTTLVPNLGVVDAVNFGNGLGYPGMVLVDIPGLLEGAHQGVGLGLTFLRHIERCRMILHIVDGSSADPVGDYLAINRELSLFSDTVAKKPQVVVLNKVALSDTLYTTTYYKIDLPAVLEKKEMLMSSLQGAIEHTRIVAVSSATGEGVLELMRRAYQMLSKLEKVEEQ